MFTTNYNRCNVAYFNHNYQTTVQILTEGVAAPLLRLTVTWQTWPLHQLRIRQQLWQDQSLTTYCI